MNAPIPPKLDFQMIFADLHAAGWNDQKLEIALSFGKGYVSLLRSGNIARISLEYASRLHNLWLDERRSERNRTLAATTT